MGRPKKSDKKAGRKPKIPLTDVLGDKYCIAREHIDLHIETWTDEEKFERLEKATPKAFDSKQDAEDYVEQFKDVTDDFSEHALTPIVVIPLKRILAHSYDISIVRTEDGNLRPEIDISVAVRGKGTPWSSAVEAARAPFVELVNEATAELDAFLDERIARERELEQKAQEAKAVLDGIDKSLRQYSPV